VLDLDEATQEALHRTYATLAHAIPQLKVMLTT
jgi:5-methyltetrahydropteroyltriglutamate--homocysteine methyltransferase